MVSWALLGWVGGTGDAHRVLRESEPANLRLRKVLVETKRMVRLFHDFGAHQALGGWFL